MDLGLPGQGSVWGTETGAPAHSKIGSGSEEDGWRSSKLARTEDLSVFKTLSFHQGFPILRSGPSDPRRQDNMLSFSSEKSEALGSGKDAGLEHRSSVFPCTQQTSSYYRNTGYGYGGMNTGMQGNFTGVRGPFSQSQWVELELQALIYKYITSNVPIPSSLLLSLKKSCYSYGFSSPSPGSYPPSSLGWGSFHLGFSTGSTDPEPGRCRRTDGKKWRCSRDAVPDQKYCERHINRGRHRSRKPVEGHTGQAATTTKPTKSAAFTGPAITNVAIPGGSAIQNLPTGGSTSQPSADSLAIRVQNQQGQSTFSPTNLQLKESLTVPRQDNLYNFGLVSSDSLLNPSHKNPYLNCSKNSGSYFGYQESQTQNPTTDDSAIAWPDELKSDWTRLSMSIPVASSGFSSSLSSHNHEKLALSPLRLSREFEPITEMGLGLNTDIGDPGNKLNSWIPISWGNSAGGPLGEVLTSTANSPKLGSSPTGVLQKPGFGSLSNSSSVSSPVGENKNHGDGVGLYVVSSIPSL